MKTIFVLLILVVIAARPVTGQMDLETPLGAGNSSVKIDPTKPSVYVEYDHLGNGKVVLSSDSKQRIWLRVINNTVWSIKVGSFFLDNKHRELFHSVETVRDWIKTDQVPQGYKAIDTGIYPYEIKSRGEFMFSVPINHLAVNLKVGIDFSYGWENTSELSPPPYAEPKHKVYYTSADLHRALRVHNSN